MTCVMVEICLMLKYNVLKFLLNFKINLKSGMVSFNKSHRGLQTIWLNVWKNGKKWIAFWLYTNFFYYLSVHFGNYECTVSETVIVSRTRTFNLWITIGMYLTSVQAPARTQQYLQDMNMLTSSRFHCHILYLYECTPICYVTWLIQQSVMK